MCARDAEGFEGDLGRVGPRETAFHAQAVFVALLDSEERADTRKKLLDGIGRAREARGILQKNALLEGKSLHNLKKSAVNGFPNLRRLGGRWRLFGHAFILKRERA